ncbi:hypothetical protein [Pseudoalteromonas denitrificans]|uniref:Uncharacterized protein n=1 Tax=Pseudoalteromonas denitrificans DSM 6059 TaxID=1123010 RepID=A0A1I1G9D1_9GAMM|nr:hypothetical protein [Pseudoalteromonas denitrificans]SFC07902.1 hypothetical protein SAMN02745724_00857 [Pseudoalteromonas denitrificans DSM 6059]
MKPQINADQGFKRREKIFIDSPLRHFIEDEILVSTSISKENFYEVLSILVAEFGSKLRKDNYVTRQKNELKVHDKVISSVILDEHCCEIPKSIILCLISSILRQEHGEDLKNTHINKMIERISQLLPSIKSTIKDQLSIIETSNINNYKVA